jgi:quercetin dioxygenase-like cupin family protein
MSADQPRRVITGLDAEGRSAVILDGPLQSLGGGGAQLVWRTDGVPADNSAREDIAPIAFNFDTMHGSGTMFMIMDFAPGMPEFWHTTDTLEYIVMLAGEIVFQTESGEVTLRAGDCLVDRGIAHSWRNDSGAPARAAITMIPAHPVGKGRTV